MMLYGEHSSGNGDCFTACLASLLELPLWMVPPFHMMYGRPDTFSRIDQWLARFFNMELEFVDDIKNPGDLPEFYIVLGKSPRNNEGHAVVYSKGVLAHDPNPAGGGVTEVWSIRYLKEL